MRRFISVLFYLLVCNSIHSQVVINEASCRNFSQIFDSSGDNPDWIELFNPGNESINVWGFHLSDDPENRTKWTIPNVSIPAKKWLLIFASGSDEVAQKVNHWETAVKDTDTWKWICPDESTSLQWMYPGFNDVSWNADQGGFGYGDGDDLTLIPEDKVSVFTRISFEIKDVSKIVTAILNVDFDDGFVAYLNGNEIARDNINTVAWNSTATASHEALLFQGKRPYDRVLNMAQLSALLHNGTNVFAVQGHNYTTGLIDMSLRTFLSFGMADAERQFSTVPDWFKSDTDGELHANFKISNQGETIYLYDNNGMLMDQLVLPPNLPVNSSVGSDQDGSSARGIFLIASPNASNNNQKAYTEGMVPAPVMSFTGGYYASPISVVITAASPELEIRYTTNGQEPGFTSELYTGTPVTITLNTVLKARCMGYGQKLSGPVTTNTYFINQNPTPAAVLSITMNNEDLYGETGIYDNWWTDWKRQCYFEYFSPDTHQSVVKQFAGIKIEGGAGGSRSNPQRSFRLEPGNGTLGEGDVNYPLIPGIPQRDSYANFYIRNGSNQYLYYPCKDAIETRCMGEGTYNTYAGYTPVQVYLNGDYWGYYELREKLDEDYFKQYSDTDEDSLQILSVSYWYGGELREVHGTDPVGRFNDDYDRFLNLNTNSSTFWQEADRYFDLEHYTDYICAQNWMANVDWPYNNIRIHRSPETGHRWRFSLIDLEWSLNPNGWSNRYTDHLQFILDYDTNNPYIHIWQKAMKNRVYRNYFINRFADLMNTAWTKQRLTAIANEIYTVTRPELPATFKRWGEAGRSVESYMQDFDNAHLVMLEELSNRSEMVRSHIMGNLQLSEQVIITLDVAPAGSGTIRISTVKPDAYPWQGIYFDGVPVKIEAIPNPGFAFVSWDANALITDVAKAIFLDTLEQSTLFKANFKTEGYSDRVIVSEINYNSESSVDAGDWIEIWNYHKTLNASLNGWYFTDDDPTHIYRFPENTSLLPGQRLVIVNEQVKFKSVHPGIPFVGTFSFGLGGGGDAVRLYDHNNQLVSSVYYDDEGPWPLGADGQGRTLELKSELLPVANPASWFDGCIGGSPGKPYSPCGDPILFSEINYYSSSNHDHGDWVEWRNIGETALNLSGWVFRDGVDSTGHAFLIPPGTVLAPKSHIVLVQDTGKFRALNPTISNYIGPFEFGLKNTGEWIRAYDASGKLRLSVRYNDKAPWPILGGGAGYTLELVDSSGLMNDGLNWMTGCLGGSPGQYYTSDCSAMGVIENALGTLKVYPNPTTDKLNIDESGPFPYRIVLQNLLGQVVISVNNAYGSLELSLQQLPAGPYTLTLFRDDGSKEVVKVMKQ
jgi:hypothetical protein